jgi:hypothetical protein
VVVVAGFAAAGADPYLKLLLWVNTPGALGLMVLQTLTAVAVLVFFLRDRRGENVLRVVVAPAAATVLLIGATAIMVTKINLLTAAGPTVNTVLVGLVPAVLLVGVAGAFARRRRSVGAASTGQAES